MERFIFGVFALVIVAACGSDSGGAKDSDPTLTPPVQNNDAACIDNDGDGFGEMCVKGPDCNDFDPNRQECPCEEGNFPGCACDTDGATEPCYDGPQGTEGVASCSAGVRSCDGGAWSVCRGQTPPYAETCNTKDDDCDGRMDEELELTICGSCDSTCQSHENGGDAGWDLNEDNSTGLVENPDGSIQLEEGATSASEVLWIANGEGTVSKIDTVTGEEVGRYQSALRVVPGIPTPLTGCQGSAPQGNCPSRTAVDLRGDVWVANRAFAGQGSVTKIAVDNCVDKNGNGRIDTSTDANGNGVINLNDPAEFLGADDECILFTIPVGENQGLPRALAVDPFHPDPGVGSVWVGNYREQRYYQLSGDDGTLLRTIDVPHRPYGAVFDRFKVLWSTTIDNSNLVAIRRIDDYVVDGPYVYPGNDCDSFYGISVDRNDDIWVGGWSCNGAYRFRPTTEEWLRVPFGNQGGYSRGIAADADGWVYSGISNDVNGDAVGRIAKFREDGSELSFVNTAAAEETIGVGLDSQGKVWAVNRGSANATQLTPSINATQVFPVGADPYTYSDFTGYALRNFAAPQGLFRRIFLGCSQFDQTFWQSIVWEGETPAGTTISARARSADSIDALAAASFTETATTSPIDLSALEIGEGKYLEVELVLTSELPGVTPKVWQLDVGFTCPVPQ